MRTLLILGAITLLAACTTTPQKMRTTSPVLEINSTLTAEQVSMCIATGWENIDYILYSPIVTDRRTPSGHEVAQHLDGSLTYLADIKRTQSGVAVTIYSAAIEFDNDPAFITVKQCAQSEKAAE
ncbi:hypothetical protein [Vibrio sp. 16]|uniref:hypothetical protein n=1 Tax=Vibrio sp. 16 TaxID=391586 RepID=UPI00018F1B90|nr:hypothetical protein [Vibrio sp. 16]EED25392.1 hypothetical protein VPMS16_2762 [Vibrio sp. 16]CAK4076570.1 hypothetical protein PVDT1_46 [Vibrio sp. 16]